MGIAVGVFGDEQIVADEQRRYERTRGNVEGLEQDRAHHERDQERLDDDLDGFPPALLLLDGRDGGVGGFHGRFDHSAQYALPSLVHAALGGSPPASPIQRRTACAKLRLVTRKLGATKAMGFAYGTRSKEPVVSRFSSAIWACGASASGQRWPIRILTPPLPTTRKRSRAIFSASARSAMKLVNVGRVANSEPFCAKRLM